MFLTIAILYAFVITEFQAVDNNMNNTTQIRPNGLSNNRTGKFIGWWLGIGVGVVRFENSVCPAANGLQGICYTRRQCASVGGYASGKCAKNIGVCCVVQVTCGATSSNNNTYFTNLGFPNTFSGVTVCTLTIQRCNADICQVRIDFLSLRLEQPNSDGFCRTDALIISGAATVISRICGENTGQHIYLDFNNGNDITLTIVTGAASAFARQWNIRVAQIGCDSPSRAPTGCLMYYTTLTGTVRSFNYGQTVTSVTPGNTDMFGTRQLADMNYGVCIRMAPGYCSIQWSPTGGDPYAFTVSGDTNIPTTTPTTMNDCMTDFVVIPNGGYVMTPPDVISADRYCGNFFPTVTTSSKPFVLTAVTNGTELADGDNANRGFSLSYSQQICSSDLL